MLISQVHHHWSVSLRLANSQQGLARGTFLPLDRLLLSVPLQMEFPMPAPVPTAPLMPPLSLHTRRDQACQLMVTILTRVTKLCHLNGRGEAVLLVLVHLVQMAQMVSSSALSQRTRISSLAR